MPSPEILAAIAAIASATAAAITAATNRSRLEEDVRPELMPINWTRPANDILRFGGIQNNGRGTAYAIVFDALAIDDARPLVGMTTQIIQAIRATEAEGPACEIRLFWQNVAGEAKTIPFDIVIRARDSRGKWRTATHRYFAFEQVAFVAPVGMLTDGLVWTSSSNVQDPTGAGKVFAATRARAAAPFRSIARYARETIVPTYKRLTSRTPRS